MSPGAGRRGGREGLLGYQIGGESGTMQLRGVVGETTSKIDDGPRDARDCLVGRETVLEAIRGL